MRYAMLENGEAELETKTRWDEAFEIVGASRSVWAWAAAVQVQG